MPRVIKYDPEDTFNLIAAVVISEGDLVGIDTNGKAALADADATPAAGVCNEAIGVAVRAAAIGDAVAVCPQATVDGFSSLTVAARQWLSNTAGARTETMPTTVGNTLQPLGRAKNATTIQFNVCPAVGKYQAAATTTIVPM